MAEFSGRFVGKFVPFKRDERRDKIIRILNRIERYAEIKERYEELSKKAKQRLEWIKKAREWKNVSKICRYYGISRKTFYKWKKRYELFGIGGLEDISRAPIKKRQPEITREQEIRIIRLRKENIRYGPKKIAVIYEKIYGEKISSWKVYRVIR
ncbi:MAG: helix-turn-helix domain-containing protein, partial [Candidatus Ratteibacteria bacterium]